MSSSYKFECQVQGQDLDLYYEDAAVAIDLTPNIEHRRYEHLRQVDMAGYEVIMPVAEVENLITNLQTMVAKIRENFPDAA